MKSLNKLVKLKKFIIKSRKVIVAFSGGVDSTFLAKVARDVLGKDRILLVTARSAAFPEDELADARRMAEFLGLNHKIISSEELDIPGFSENPPDRCYHCKVELFGQIRKIASDQDYSDIFDGSNRDDLQDYRPGRKALEHFNIKSPLIEAGFLKKEIRKLSGSFHLPTANKQSYACLASRFPYGEKITSEKLDRVGNAEKGLKGLGFHQFRVRSHQDLARIEFSVEEMDRAWEFRNDINEICELVGFLFTSIDLKGYKTGSMNRMLAVTE